MRSRIEDPLPADDELALLEIGGRRIAIGAVGGTPYAIDDACPHTGCSLAQGEIDGWLVTCLCHGSQFDIRSGAVIQGPASRDVASFPVVADGDTWWVEL